MANSKTPIKRKTATPKPVSVQPEVSLEKPVESQPIGHIGAQPISESGMQSNQPNPNDSLTEDQKQMVTIIIDRKRTSGGLVVNGKRYVGTVTVPKHQAEDLMRMQEEYDESMQKIFDPSVSVRMKNDLQKEVLFLVDPKEHARNPGFTRDYGLLPLQEWEYCSPAFKEHLLAERKQLYGY
jgi:hypothetical protein